MTIPITVLRNTDIHERLMSALETKEVVVDLFLISSIAYYQDGVPSLLNRRTTRGVFNVKYLGTYLLATYFDKAGKLKTIYIWFSLKKLKSMGIEPNKTYHFIVKFRV